MLSALNFRSNGIGFLRFLFAATVIWSHAFGLGGYGLDPLNAYGARLSAGFLAVAGFFVLSGFLITRSFESAENGGRFLWHRCLRIFPGFLSCLVLTAFLIVPIGFLRLHANLHGYLTIQPAPLTYVTRNAALQINQFTIGGILDGLPQSRLLNGSLWTLQSEFYCYLTLLLAGALGILKRWPVVILAGCVAACVITSTCLSNATTMDVRMLLYLLSELATFFWIGGCAYLYRDSIAMRGSVAAICAVLVLVALPSRLYGFIVIPCFSYLVLYAMVRVPIRNFDRRIDLSYGLYIYAYPVAQVLALFGLNKFGVLPYFALSLIATLPWAALSWFVIERPSLSLKGLRLRGLPEPGFEPMG